MKNRTSNIDGPVKSRIFPYFVIPAKAGIQWFRILMDSGLRRSDGFWHFLRLHRTSNIQHRRRLIRKWRPKAYIRSMFAVGCSMFKFWSIGCFCHALVSKVGTIFFFRPACPGGDFSSSCSRSQWHLCAAETSVLPELYQARPPLLSGSSDTAGTKNAPHRES